MKDLYMPYREDIVVYEEEHIFSSDDKLEMWGYGEWVEEIDVLIFTYLDYNCSITRICKEMKGHLRGYICVPREHVIYDMPAYIVPIDAHGGVSIAEQTEEGYVVGFECCTFCDVIPLYEKRLSQIINELRGTYPIPAGLSRHPWFHPIYRNIEYCIDECCHIVQQLTKIQSINTIRNGDDASSG